MSQNLPIHIFHSGFIKVIHFMCFAGCDVISESDQSLKPCAFPFIFDDKIFYGCTKYLNYAFWCSVETNSTDHHVTNQWGYCNEDCPQDSNLKPPPPRRIIQAVTTCKTTQDSKDPDAQCQFPFKYHGVEHSQCLFDPQDNRAWCSTATDASGKHISGKDKWGFCSSQHCSMQDSKSCNNVINQDDQKSTSCVFPFIFDNKIFNGCTKYLNYNFWCSVRTNDTGHHVAGKWGFCNENCSKDYNPKPAPTTIITDDPSTSPAMVLGTTKSINHNLNLFYHAKTF